MNKHQLARIFTKPPELQTKRLLLRKLAVSDFADMFEYSRLEEVTRYLVWEPHPDEHYTARYLDTVQTQYRSGDFYDWGVVWRETGKLIGTCGFTSVDLANNRGEVGYVINPAFRGRGIASEALMAVLDYAFNELKLHRIEAKYIYGNDASRRVMEKCSMTFEGIMRGYMYIKREYRDIGLCSILYDDYRRIYGAATFYDHKSAQGMNVNIKKMFDKEWFFA
jgi:Acetyltransferases, including N-acetylases of ribosomal proteins